MVLCPLCVCGPPSIIYYGRCLRCSRTRGVCRMSGLLPQRSRFVVIFFAACLLVSCKARPKVATAPAKPAVPEELIRQHVAQGDAEFSKQHLFGWRQAETAYAKALDLDDREMIREKLQLTRFLIKTREE